MSHIFVVITFVNISIWEQSTAKSMTVQLSISGPFIFLKNYLHSCITKIYLATFLLHMDMAPPLPFLRPPLRLTFKFLSKFTKEFKTYVQLFYLFLFEFKPDLNLGLVVRRSLTGA